MKKIIIFIIILILIIIGGYEINRKIHNYNQEEATVQNFIDIPRVIDNEKINDIVVVQNGCIRNENLIDDFLEKVSQTEEKITLIIYDYIDDTQYNEKKIEFYPGQVVKNMESDGTETVKIPENDDLDGFGYYIYTVNNDSDSSEKFPVLRWSIKRNTDINNKVNLIFANFPLIQVSEIPIICSYDLDYSNYKKNIYMNCYEKENAGVTKIIDKNSSEDYEFDIYTFDCDINFTIDGDMVYEFKQALDNKIITVSDILQQAKEDTKYGICQEEMYSDGGTMEYFYPEYTIIKYDTLDGNSDFVIGPKGEIRYQVDKILYNE